MFIKQIFYGVLEKRDFLKVTTEALFKAKPGSTERKDELLFSIFIYMAVFRMNELSLDDFKSLALVKTIFFIFFFFLKFFNFLKNFKKKIGSRLYENE